MNPSNGGDQQSGSGGSGGRDDILVRTLQSLQEQMSRMVVVMDQQQHVLAAAGISGGRARTTPSDSPVEVEENSGVPGLQHSTCESEAKAATEVVKEVVWQRNFLDEVSLPQVEPTIVYSDSRSAIDLLEKEGFTARTKHVEHKLKFVRELIQGVVELVSASCWRRHACRLLNQGCS